MLTCKQVSIMLSQAQERRLSLLQRAGLGLHLALCHGCRNFRRQLGFIRAAARRFPGDDPAA